MPDPKKVLVRKTPAFLFEQQPQALRLTLTKFNYFFMQRSLIS